MSKSKAAPYWVYLVFPTLAIQPHHHYPKMKEAIRVAKKRRPRDGWTYVTNKDGEIVWSSKGFEDIVVSLEDALKIMDRIRKS